MEGLRKDRPIGRNKMKKEDMKDGSQQALTGGLRIAVDTLRFEGTEFRYPI